MRKIQKSQSCNLPVTNAETSLIRKFWWLSMSSLHTHWGLEKMQSAFTSYPVFLALLVMYCVERAQSLNTDTTTWTFIRPDNLFSSCDSVTQFLHVASLQIAHVSWFLQIKRFLQVWSWLTNIFTTWWFWLTWPKGLLWSTLVWRAIKKVTISLATLMMVNIINTIRK